MTRYYLGIDGGGSKTLGVLIDEHGTLLASARGARSAIVGAPSPASLAVLAGIARQLCADAAVEPAAVTGVGLGLNGIDFADEFPTQHLALSACLEVSPARLLLVNDGIVALWGASPAPTLAIVQHGSGITCASRSGYGREQLFDHLNAGHIFDMRYALAHLVARMIDGRAAPTPLKDAALRYYGVAEEADFAEAFFRQSIPDERLRSAITMLYSAWEAGDPAAACLVEAAAEDYACTARALVTRTGDPRCQVAFAGGIINHAPAALLTRLAEKVHTTFPEVTVIRPRLSPAHGAALMIAFHHGGDPARLFARLSEQYSTSKG